MLSAQGLEPVAFTIPAFRRDMLLAGADEIGLTLQRSPQIQAWQAATRAQRPWEWASAAG